MAQLSRVDLATLANTKVAEANTIINNNITTNGVRANTGARVNEAAQKLKAIIDEITVAVKDSHFNIISDTTNVIVEGNNPDKWFFSEANFNTRLATKTTDNLAEGTTNLYYTQARVDARINTLRPTQSAMPAVAAGTTRLIGTANGKDVLAVVEDLELRTAFGILVSKLQAANIIS
jgi:phenylpyruvate tautomerase PptA (4-oxalocrotonate tautomerase family)